MAKDQDVARDSAGQLPDQVQPVEEDARVAAATATAVTEACQDHPGFARGIRRGLNHGPRVGRGPRTY